MALSDTCSPCWGARIELRPGKLRYLWACAVAAVLALALWCNGLPWWLRLVLLGLMAVLLLRWQRRQRIAEALWLWPGAITVQCEDGQRRLFETPFAAGFWPGCVRLEELVLYRDQMADGDWRRLCLVLRH